MTFEPHFPFVVKATLTKISEHEFVVNARDEKEALELAHRGGPGEGDVVDWFLEVDSVKIED